MPDNAIEINGMIETQEKINQVVTDLRGPAFLDGMRRATALVSADAKRLSPVDSGRLRASLMPEIRQEGRTTLGVVGSNVEYAAAVELGSRAHWAPSGPLKLWARRKGATEFLLHMGSAPFVYLKAKKGVFYLQNAFNKNVAKIKDIIGNVVSEIVNK